MSSVNESVGETSDDLPIPQPSPFRRLALCGFVVWILQTFFMHTYYSAFTVKQNAVDPNQLIAALLLNMIYAVLIVWAFSHKKAMSYGKACIFLFLLSTVFDSFTDLRGDKQNAKALEEVMKSLLVVFKEYAQAMSSVKDDATAQTALSRMEELYQRAKKITADVKKLPPVTKKDREEVLNQYKPLAQRAGEKLRDAFEGLQNKLKERYGFEQEVEKLFQLLQDINKDK